jgi:hypothetical protein
LRCFGGKEPRDGSRGFPLRVASLSARSRRPPTTQHTHAHTHQSRARLVQPFQLSVVLMRPFFPLFLSRSSSTQTRSACFVRRPRHRMPTPRGRPEVCHRHTCDIILVQTVLFRAARAIASRRRPRVLFFFLSSLRSSLGRVGCACLSSVCLSVSVSCARASCLPACVGASPLSGRNAFAGPHAPDSRTRLEKACLVVVCGILAGVS